MSEILLYFVLLPCIGFVLSLLVSRKRERLLSGIALAVAGLQLAGLVAFTGYWVFQGSAWLDHKQFTVYKSPGFEFFIQFYFDRVTAVFALVGALLIFLVALFSKFYMHRESGFKRYFNTLLLFSVGYNFVVFSGNFETLFLGWEVLGITSFLLIAFYRDRYLPVRNALKVLSFYRLSDIALLLAMWISHHLWDKNIPFSAFEDTAVVLEHYQEHYAEALSLALLLILTAAIKSAQMPFSTWLPRAMEGPTTSSAIFYGALSVHIGAFLLLRTYAFWSHNGWAAGCIMAIGLISAVAASAIARVQSSVKVQIAYASIAQIGLIFIEIALGWHTLALVHFAGNALLRTYQLLVSPSVLSYQIHDMFFNFVPQPSNATTGLWSRMKQTLYILAIKEGNLDGILSRSLWKPFKWVGQRLNVLHNGWFFILALLTGIAGLMPLFSAVAFSAFWSPYIVTSALLLSLTMVLKAFSDRTDARNTWALIAGGQLLGAIAMLNIGHATLPQIGLYLSGVVTAAVAGYICLGRIAAIDREIALHQYHGYSYERPLTALVFLLACLGLLGFPITPTFIGIDLFFTLIHSHQVAYIALAALQLLFLELAALRIYVRVFLGQHKKTDHPVAFKMS